MRELKEKNEEAEKRANALAEQIAAAKQKQQEYEKLLAKLNSENTKQVEDLTQQFKKKNNQAT